MRILKVFFLLLLSNLTVAQSINFSEFNSETNSGDALSFLTNVQLSIDLLNQIKEISGQGYINEDITLVGGQEILYEMLTSVPQEVLGGNDVEEFKKSIFKSINEVEEIRLLLEEVYPKTCTGWIGHKPIGIEVDSLYKYEERFFSAIELLGRAWARIQISSQMDSLKKPTNQIIADNDSIVNIVINNFKRVKDTLNYQKLNLVERIDKTLEDSSALSPEHKRLLQITRVVAVTEKDAETKSVLENCLSFADWYQEYIGVQIEATLDSDDSYRRLKLYWENFLSYINERSELAPGDSLFLQLSQYTQGEKFTYLLNDLIKRQYEYRRFFANTKAYTGSYESLDIALTSDGLNDYLELIYEHLSSIQNPEIDTSTTKSVFFKLLPQEAQQANIQNMVNKQVQGKLNSFAWQFITHQLNTEDSVLDYDQIKKIVSVADGFLSQLKAIKEIIEGYTIPISKTVAIEFVPSRFTIDKSGLNVSFLLQESYHERVNQPFEIKNYGRIDSVNQMSVKNTGIVFESVSLTFDDIDQLSATNFLNRTSLKATIKDTIKFTNWVKSWGVPGYLAERIDNFDYQQGITFSTINKCYQIRLFKTEEDHACSVLLAEDILASPTILTDTLKRAAIHSIRQAQDTMLEELDNVLAPYQLTVSDHKSRFIDTLTQILIEKNINLNDSLATFKYPLEQVNSSFAGLSVLVEYNLKNGLFDFTVDGSIRQLTENYFSAFANVYLKRVQTHGDSLLGRGIDQLYAVDSLYLDNYDTLYKQAKHIFEEGYEFEIYARSGSVARKLGVGKLSKNGLTVSKGQIALGGGFIATFNSLDIDLEETRIATSNVTIVNSESGVEIISPEDSIQIVYQEDNDQHFSFRGSIEIKLQNYLVENNIWVRGINIEQVSISNEGINLQLNFDSAIIAESLGLPSMTEEQLSRIESLVSEAYTVLRNGLLKIDFKELLNEAIDYATQEFITYVNIFLGSSYNVANENLEIVKTRVEDRIEALFPTTDTIRWVTANGDSWEPTIQNGVPSRIKIDYSPSFLEGVTIKNVGFIIKNAKLDFSETKVVSTEIDQALKSTFRAVNAEYRRYENGFIFFDINLSEDITVSNVRLSITDGKLDLSNTNAAISKDQLTALLPFLVLEEDPVFDQGTIKFAGSIPFSFVDNQTSMIVNVAINIAEFDFTSSASIENFLLQNIASQLINQSLPYSVVTNAFKLQLDQGYAEKKYLYLTGQVIYSEKASITISMYVIIEIDLSNGKIRPEFGLDAAAALEPIKEGIVAGVNEILESFETIKVQSAQWDQPNPNTLPKGIIFKINMSLPSPLEAVMVSIPDMRINLQGVEFIGYSGISISLPTDIPIPPYFRLASASGTIQDSQISLGGRLTLLPPGSEYLIVLNGNFSYDFKELDRLEASASLYAFVVINLGNGQTIVDINDGYFSQRMDFELMSSDIFTFDGELEVTGKEKRIQGQADVSFFGQPSATGEVRLGLSDQTVYAKGAVDLEFATISGALQSGPRFSKISYTGKQSIGIGGFELANAFFMLSSATSSVGFKVLGIKGNFVTPGHSISKSELINYIKDLLTPDLSNLDEAIKQILKGNITINLAASFGSGSGAGGVKGEGGDAGGGAKGSDGVEEASDANGKDADGIEESNSPKGQSIATGYGGLGAALAEIYGGESIPGNREYVDPDKPDIVKEQPSPESTPFKDERDGSITWQEVSKDTTR